MHPLRLKIRKDLHDNSGLELKNVRALFKKYHQSQLVEAFLHFSKFPEFNLNTTKWQTTLSQKEFNKAIPEIKLFYKKSNISKLFATDRIIYNKNIKKLNKSIIQSIWKSKNLFNIKTPVKKIILIPNFFDAYWRGYGPIINSTQYIIFGPCKTKTKYEFLIRHEFFHGLVNPRLDSMIKKIFNKLRSQIVYLDKINKLSYRQKEAIANEYIVRSLNIIFVRKYSSKQFKLLIADEKQKGFNKIENVVHEIKNALPHLR